MDDPQEEITGGRPKEYSQWHRVPNLPSWCYVTDGDWFEQRTKNGKFQSVAYIETIQIPTIDEALVRQDYWPWRSKRSLMKEIEQKMGIPAYVVWHTKDCNDFLVNKFGQTKLQRMNEQEYKEFIKNL